MSKKLDKYEEEQLDKLTEGSSVIIVICVIALVLALLFFASKL